MRSSTKVIRFDSLPLWRGYMQLTQKKVVATNGCFDILHRGHASYLQHARQLGDVLIVGVNSDQAVRELKGEDRPVNPQEDRAFMLAALECVDCVVIFDQVRATEFLLAACPSVWVKGGDYTIDTLDPEEVSVVRSAYGEIEIIPTVAGYSTTRTITQLRNDVDAPVPGDEVGSVLRSPESLR